LSCERRHDRRLLNNRLPKNSTVVVSQMTADPQVLTISRRRHRCRRRDLPDWHVERFAGDVNDEFVLTEDDELIEE
jgi:hypothetical protein